MIQQASAAASTIFTIGHSTRTLEELIETLKAYGVELLVDVRTVTRSRRNPQFNRETLPQALGAAGIEYLHLAGLGGWRHSRPDSPNTGWRGLAFRGYADYMQTEDFRENLRELIELAGRKKPAIMCAEAVPWRCHRWLIADALAARGARVEHILSEKHSRPHALTQWARVQDGRITYPPA